MMPIMEAKKVRIDMVTLHPIPSLEIELDIFTFTYIDVVKIIKVITLLVMVTFSMGPDNLLFQIPRGHSCTPNSHLLNK